MNSFSLEYDDEYQLTSQAPNHSYTTFTNQGSYAFSAMLPQDADLPLQNFARSQPSDLDGQRSNVMLTYDAMPTSGISMPMNMNATNAYTYDIPATYPATTGGMPPQMDQSQFQSTYSLFPHAMAVPHFPQLAPPAFSGPYNTSTASIANFEDSDFSGGMSDWSQAQVQVQRARRQPPERHLPTGQPYRALRPVAIQPKKPVAATEGFSPGLAKPEIGKTEHTGIYSTTGFDVLGALGRVAMRRNPKINIGAVDLSCAFVMCDILTEDHPIVYVSEAFERLTGYTKNEIVGRNCRFLQAPDGRISAGAKRTFVDGQTVYRLRSTIDDRSEIQASIINYRKGGQPFMNLITMIPIQWDSDVYRYYVGFQVDLVEKPDAVRGRNPDGNYNINYRRDQLPQYIVPSPDVYSRPDLGLRYGHDEVTTILNAMNAVGNDANRHCLDRILVENTDDVIHVLSFNGEFLYLSPSCHKILEYDPVELIGKTLSTICHPSDIGPVIRELRASTTTATLSVVYRIRQKHRGYMWFESHGAWHIDPNQGRRHLVMTGRPRPVYTLDQIARLGSLPALAENDIWAKVSLSGVILFITTKVKPVLGRSPDDLIGKGLQEFMQPETGGTATITQALEAASGGQGPGMATVFGSGKETGEPPSFKHQMWHRKGHALSAHTTLYTGDAAKGTKPSFLVAQIRFARPFPPPAAISAAEDKSLTTLTVDDTVPPQQYGALGQRMPELSNLIGLNGLPTGNRSSSSSADPTTFFTELNPTRGSSWQIELRELEKQNGTLADELQRLVARRRKRKRKHGAMAVEKICAMCNTKNTPEWRRGPSGNRDLCNSCGLRWAKQIRSQAQAQAAAS
ncbi:hypothetical protein N7519_008832 [Penicillium mononematosum]|uniref:uncharacterized protein n=1 Tax=Penicillium mononematosum TaxID=268346 RepID=UPI0025472188|nr:uncharacterized protein N7519_008832 [Penicillium mononematosum]KAJ6178371.1 hypothetical protein N7519_008832 [Penicillium mononematosum]